MISYRKTSPTRAYRATQAGWVEIPTSPSDDGVRISATQRLAMGFITIAALTLCVMGALALVVGIL